jgi:alpha-N-arabinofuranosidase
MSGSTGNWGFEKRLVSLISLDRICPSNEMGHQESLSSQVFYVSGITFYMHSSTPIRRVALWVAVALTIIGFSAICSAQRSQTAEIQIDASRVVNHISPRMYAAFTEMMAEDVKRGLTAEMLHNRSFEEAPDYLGLPAGWRLEPDERNDNVGAIRFAPTTDEAYPAMNLATHAPEHSLRVTLAPGDIIDRRRGLSQGRLSVVAGQRYRGYVWIKTASGKAAYTGPMIVALEEDNTDGRRYAEATLAGFSDGWRQYVFTLQPKTTDRFAKLSLLFGGTGTLYMDQVSLERQDAQSQVRPDTESAIRLLRPSFLRWPGGNVAQDYHWQWGSVRATSGPSG